MADTRQTSVDRAYGEAPPPPRVRRSGTTEKVVLVHLSVLVVGLSWSFGGQIDWARDALLVWGTLGMLMFFLLQASPAAGEAGLRINPWRYLWPLLLFDALVIVSCFNPSTRTAMHQGEMMFLHVTPRWEWLPSAARPDLAFRELWQFNAILLSCANAFFAGLSRGALRRLLVVLVANGLALAIFGTFQKLLRADGLWFGLVPSPNPFFFATFVYHNHWGPFTLLNVAAGIGLLFHSWRRGGYRDFWHSPVLMGAVGLLLFAAAVPLSGSRSSSVLVLLLLLGALGHTLLRIIRRRRERHESAALPVAGLIAGTVLAGAGIFFLARGVIETRARDTLRQIEEIRGETLVNSRLRLYGDTWRMASERPVFGWGLESYATVFMIYNSTPTPLRGGWKQYYEQAHNDWLQALAEVGFTGTALVGLLVLLPLAGVAWRRIESHIPGYLLTGCLLLLLYAWVEFPFANPSVMVSFWLCLYIAARYARLDLGQQRTAHE